MVLGILQFSCGLLPIEDGQAPPTKVTATQEVVPSPENLEGTPTLAAPPPTETQLPSTATQTVAPAATEEAYEAVVEEIYIFKVQDGSPLMTQAWTHDCNWLGVAGQAFDLDGSPLHDLVVEAGGEIDGQPILGLALTGRSSPYGDGGYELKLLDAPMASKDSVWVQLKDSNGNSLSPQILLETAVSCDQNLVLINFVADEAVLGNTIYVPLIQP